MKLDVSEILNVSLNSVLSYLDKGEVDRVLNIKGTEGQYRFYAWLSYKFNNITILDLGTRKGTSAITFAINPTNKVITYDNRLDIDYTELQKNGLSNVFFRQQDVLDIQLEIYNKADIIHLDLWHTGIPEQYVLNIIEKSDFSGILIMDDIWQHRKWPELREIYRNINKSKLVLPMEIGHFTGTGIVLFGDQKLKITL